jgi:hypothetical protein
VATTSESMVENVTGSFGAALAPLTEGVGKAVGAAHTAVGGDGAATEEAVTKKTKSAIKYIKERFKRMFVTSTKKNEPSPGPDEAPDRTATSTAPTPTPAAALPCDPSADG